MLFGSVILDTAIGVVFVFLLLSLIATAVQEALQVFLKSRAKHLEAGIKRLLNDGTGTGLAGALYQHPLVRGLYDASKPKDRPSYIPTRNFAVALLDMVARGTDPDDATQATGTAQPISVEGVRLTVQKIGNQPVQRAILAALDTAEGSLVRAQRNLEDWYDSAMDRVSGGYKRQTQKVLIGIGLVLAIGANVDAIEVAKRLYLDKPMRDAVVQQATAYVAAHPDTTETIKALQTRLDALPLPIGWPRKPEPRGVVDYTLMIFGWIVTGLAVSLGAPFWFDLLNKFMVIRATVKPKEKSGEEGSEDRKAASTPGPTRIEVVTTAPAGAAGAAGAGLTPGPHQWAAGADPDAGVM
jgi:hypothetical protein